MPSPKVLIVGAILALVAFGALAVIADLIEILFYVVLVAAAIIAIGVFWIRRKLRHDHPRPQRLP